MNIPSISHSPKTPPPFCFPLRMLILGRLIAGVGVGITSAAGPAFISDSVWIWTKTNQKPGKITMLTGKTSGKPSPFSTGNSHVNVSGKIHFFCHWKLIIFIWEFHYFDWLIFHNILPWQDPAFLPSKLI